MRLGAKMADNTQGNPGLAIEQWLGNLPGQNGIAEETADRVEAQLCPDCGGAGMVLTTDASGRRKARECACQRTLRQRVRLREARIPRRYEHCVLESFELLPRADATLSMAQTMARRFVEGYPVETGGRGLLLTGSIGVGKTHLAVGMLLALMEQKGVEGLFYDYRELLKEIQHSYNPQVNSTELEVLRPVFEAEVLVLDELGAQKPTDWVWDTVALVLNTRYNDKRTTIITTNYPDLPPASLLTGAAAQRAAREETLGDRIGERMRSRLAEMCVRVEMTGEDFRQRAGRARFG